MTLSEKAEKYAVEKHADVNHLYAGMSYGVHLAMVVGFANRFLHLIPESDRETVLAACWAHDVIEDTRQTFNDVKKVLGLEVAEIIYALTNEKGRTRGERANEKYYKGIVETKYAPFVKACDRLANIRYSRDSGSDMFDRYKREHKYFCANLETNEYADLFDEMEYIFYPHKRPIPQQK